MIKIAFAFLYLIGLVLILVGSFLGRLRIYAIEAPFWLELQASGGSLEMRTTYMNYIDILKDQWQVVTLIGIIHIIAVTFLLSIFRKRMRTV